MALPPVSYLAFCERQPQDCGPDRARVLAGVAQARAERAALLAGVLEPAPGAIGGGAAVGAAPLAPKLSARLWRTLNAVNAQVNAALAERPDREVYGLEDWWATPLAGRGREGDCEDYALEKRRALLAAGLPHRALNLATGHTPSGEFHAVLLVSTAEGDFVLDNLEPTIRRVDQVPYRWGARQVNGEAFRWAMAAKRR